MTIQLTAPILEAGVEQATGTQLTLSADREAEMVNRGVARWVGDDPGTGGVVPAMVQTDANGAVSLVGPDGPISVGGLGDNTLTVGAGGQFPTIQAAIDSLASYEFFPADAGTDLPTTITAWNNLTNSITATGGNVASGRFQQDLWISHASSNGRRYPVLSWTSSSTLVRTRCKRLESNFSGSEAISWARESLVTILLLPGKHVEAVTINFPCAIKFSGLGDSTEWNTAVGNSPIKIGTSCTHGRIIIDSFKTNTITFFGNTINLLANAVIMRAQNIISYGANDGIFSPGVEAGVVEEVDCVTYASPSVPLGHHTLVNCTGEVIATGNIVFVAPSDAVLPDFRWFDEVGANAIGIYASNNKIICNDVGGKLNKVAFVALLDADAYIDDCAIVYHTLAASTTQLIICADDIDTSSASTKKAHISGCNIVSSALHTGTKHAYKTHVAGSSCAVIVNDCGSLSADKPGAGTLTVQSQALGVGSTGAASATLGSNSPATTPAAPNTWMRVNLNDGTAGFVPVWK